MNIKPSVALFATSILGIAALPAHPLKTWDPTEHQEREHKLWITKLRDSIANKDSMLVKPEDLIAHDKFNLADAFDVDLIAVEELQFKGDPVLAVELEMNKIRDALRDKKDQKSKTAIWEQWLKYQKAEDVNKQDVD